MNNRSRLPMLLAAILTVSAAVSAAQTEQARVTGKITDGSGAALPGATVTIAAQGAAVARPIVLTTATTGEYLTPWLPPGEYTMTFGLSGFDTRSLATIVLRAGETVVIDQQLSVAPLSETVEVTAPFLPPPAPPKAIAPPPPPPLRATPVDKEILASVCGPRQATDYSVALGHVVGHRDSDRQLIGPGDIVVLDAGENQGLVKGQNLVVRRRFATGDRYAPKKLATFAEQSAGVVQVVELRADSSVGLVVYQCGELLAGDTIEPYQPQLAVAAQGDGTPHFDEPARIVTGEHGQSLGIARQMMVIDHGIMQGVARGQRLTIFRRMPGDTTLTLGDGVIVSVRADSATIRIERANDAIAVGDLVAIHR